MGTTFYEILTGKPPFQGENHYAITQQVLHKEPLPPRKINSFVSIELEAICLKALEKEKNEEFYQNYRTEKQKYIDSLDVIAILKLN